MGGYLDQLPVTLPPTSVRAGSCSRRYAVQAALDAVRASGGCLIEAGEDRCLVAKASERQDPGRLFMLLGGWMETPALG